MTKDVSIGGMTYDTYDSDEDPSGAIGLALADLAFQRKRDENLVSLVTPSNILANKLDEATFKRAVGIYSRPLSVEESLRPANYNHKTLIKRSILSDSGYRSLTDPVTNESVMLSRANPRLVGVEFDRVYQRVFKPAVF